MVNAGIEDGIHFKCLRCGTGYRDLQDMLHCVDSHKTGEPRQRPIPVKKPRMTVKERDALDAEISRVSVEEYISVPELALRFNMTITEVLQSITRARYPNKRKSKS